MKAHLKIGIPQVMGLVGSYSAKLTTYEYQEMEGERGESAYASTTPNQLFKFYLSLPKTRN